MAHADSDDYDSPWKEVLEHLLPEFMAFYFLLYDRGWGRQRILDLVGVIDWMMHLPPGLSRRLRVDIDQLEEG